VTRHLSRWFAALNLATVVVTAGCGGRTTLAPDDVSSADAQTGGADVSLVEVDASSDQADVVPDAGNTVAPINAGCGKPLPSAQPPTRAGTPIGYLQYTVMGTGATLDGTIPAKAGPRTFWVRVPADYNPNRKYRTVYLGQACGGIGVANTATYLLYNEKQ